MWCIRARDQDWGLTNVLWTKPSKYGDWLHKLKLRTIFSQQLVTTLLTLNAGRISELKYIRPFKGIFQHRGVWLHEFGTADGV